MTADVFFDKFQSTGGPPPPPRRGIRNLITLVWQSVLHVNYNLGTRAHTPAPEEEHGASGLRRLDGDVVNEGPMNYIVFCIVNPTKLVVG